MLSKHLLECMSVLRGKQTCGAGQTLLPSLRAQHFLLRPGVAGSARDAMFKLCLPEFDLLGVCGDAWL